jgi:hypothetical protein
MTELFICVSVVNNRGDKVVLLLEYIDVVLLTFRRNTPEDFEPQVDLVDGVDRSCSFMGVGWDRYFVIY